jgi:CRP-like cAMP-binding protein
MTNLLKDIKLFKELKTEELSKLSAICKEKSFKKGDVIFSKDDLATELYILKEGECEVKAALGGPTEYFTLFRLKGEQIFGEIGFLEGKKRTATVKCAKDSKTLVIKRKDFDKLVEKHPKIGLMAFKNLSKMLAERLRGMDDQVENFLNTRSSSGRLF